MPPAQHPERHFTGGVIVRDVVLGMSDGLTVPFALAAGLAGAVQSARVVVTAGLAEIAAGAIAMGLGGYLAGRSDAAHYASERAREQREVRAMPEAEAEEIRTLLAPYGLTDAEVAPVVAALRRRPGAWVDFMMRFELGLEEPAPGQAWRSAATIAASYAVGGAVPLAPYLVAHTVRSALHLSAVLTLVALGVFGALKGRLTGARAGRSALQTVVVGGLAAAAAFALARAIS